MYRAHRALLLHVAGQKFNVPESDCEPLLQEALMSYFTAGCRIDHPKAWLVGAVCNASRHYWRQRMRLQDIEGTPIDDLPTPPEVTDIDRLDREILLRGLLEKLQPRQREVLRLHYFDGFTATEIADRMNTTVRYAQKLIWKALSKARILYDQLHPSLKV